MIKIGITYTGTEEKHTNYINWIRGNDDVEIVRLEAGDSLPESLEPLQGLVLSGGIDMHPRFYHSTVTDYPHVPEVFEEERDEFEIAAFKWALARQVPVLAVCRGMQLVNCVLGGTLTQDIGPTANAIHKFDRNDKVHGLNLQPNTFLSEIMKMERSVVNSAHHQAIQDLGEGLQVNCFSDDGLVEGIEWADRKDKAFFIGVQWHPERMYKLNLAASPVSKNLRDRFISEIYQSIKNIVQA